jgi:hypothetical protein
MKRSVKLAAVVIVAALWIAAVVARTTTLTVRAGENLQDALNAARPGDTILLEAGARFVGNFVLPAKEGAAYVTVRSAIPDSRLPGEGTRVTPSQALAFAKLRSPNNEPVLATAPGAHHWRLMFLDFEPNTIPTGDIITLGDGSPRQHTLDQVPHHLEIDRCYVHGNPDTGQKRGIALNSAFTTIANSHISDMKAIGQDSQAIAGWNGPGPFTIVNNYLEGAGENFILGGTDPSIADLIPSDVSFRFNYVSKPVAWRNSRWQVKNLFELKNAQRVLVEHNVFEHNWLAAQTGYAIVLTPRNQDGRAPWSGVRDVVFRGNVVRRTGAAFNILGYDNLARSAQTARISICHNVIADVNGETWGGSGNFLMIGDAASDIAVEHNTVIHNGSVVAAYGRPTDRFVFRDNLIRHNEYGIKGDDRATGTDSINAYFPGAIVTRNVFAGGAASRYPPGNMFPEQAAWPAQFTDYGGGHYKLTPSSPFRGAGSDGIDLGADVDAVMTAAQAAESGVSVNRRRPLIPACGHTSPATRTGDAAIDR